MNITSDFLAIIVNNYNKSNLDTSEFLNRFFNNCFEDLIKSLNITNFKRELQKQEIYLNMLFGI